MVGTLPVDLDGVAADMMDWCSTGKSLEMNAHTGTLEDVTQGLVRLNKLAAGPTTVEPYPEQEADTFCDTLVKVDEPGPEEPGQAKENSHTSPTAAVDTCAPTANKMLYTSRPAAVDTCTPTAENMLHTSGPAAAEDTHAKVATVPENTTGTTEAALAVDNHPKAAEEACKVCEAASATDAKPTAEDVHHTSRPAAVDTCTPTAEDMHHTSRPAAVDTCTPIAEKMHHTSRPAAPVDACTPAAENMLHTSRPAAVDTCTTTSGDRHHTSVSAESDADMPTAKNPLQIPAQQWWRHTRQQQKATCITLPGQQQWTQQQRTCSTLPGQW